MIYIILVYFYWLASSSLGEEALCLVSVPISSYWVALSSFDMRVYSLFYCILLCCVWLISLGDLLFSEGKWKSSEFGGKDEVGELGRVEGKETAVGINCMRKE